MLRLTDYFTLLKFCIISMNWLIFSFGGTMKDRILGQSGTKISALGIGAMSFSDFYGKSSTEISHSILSASLDLDINHIDTADIYGMGSSEERIGSFLKRNPSAKNIFKIASKGSIAKSSDGKTFFDNSKKYLESALEASLKRLGVENLELYYVHRRDTSIPIEEVTETLSGFVKQGKINQFGYSEIAPTSLERANKIHPVGAVQSEYSLSTRYPELGLLQKTKSLKTSFVAFSPVGRSLLTDKPHTEEKVKEMQFLQQNPRFIEPNLSKNIEATHSFRTLASDWGLTAGGLAIAWLLNKDNHILPIPGTRSVQYLKDMARACEKIFSENEMKEIESVLPLGWAFGDRYSVNQWVGPEKYC